MADANETASIAEKKKPAPRSYGIYTEKTLDLTTEDGLQAAAAALGGPQGTVLVKVGTADGLDPRKALQSLGADQDLEGDYKVVADTAFNDFTGVTSGTKRVVNI